MDIESGEYPVLIDTPSDVLRQFRMLVIEFHAVHQLFARRSLNMMASIFQKLTGGPHPP